MTKVEKIIFDFIEKHLVLLFIIVVTILGIAIRLCCLDFESEDYITFLLFWWNAFSNNGKQMLSEQIGDYTIPYQIVIYLMTLLMTNPLKSYKLLSIIFDFILAISSAFMFYSYSNTKSKFRASIVYALVLFSIPVILNSSCWAQCDSIYVSFIIVSLIFTKKNKNILSFIMLGIALSFKFQTIFIFPLYIYYYITVRKTSILHFFIVPIVNILMCSPALILGRNWTDIIYVYLLQATRYNDAIQLNFPSIWGLILDNSNGSYSLMLNGVALLLTILVIGIGIVLTIKSKADLSETNNFLITAIWTIFSCVIFLPSMHERYAYMLEIIALVYGAINIKRLWLPAALSIASLRGYGVCLFHFEFISIQKLALLYLFIYIYVSYIFINDVLINGKKLANNDNAIKVNHIAKEI